MINNWELLRERYNCPEIAANPLAEDTQPKASLPTTLVSNINFNMLAHGISRTD
jgi:hypothetical protein